MIVFLFLEALFVHSLYLTFFYHFFYLCGDRNAFFLLWFPWWGGSGGSLPPPPGHSCPFSATGIKGHLWDHQLWEDCLRWVAHLRPFSPWEQASQGWGVLCSSAGDKLPCHVASTTWDWVGSISLTLGFCSLSTDINHVLQLSYMPCFVASGILASICHWIIPFSSPKNIHVEHIKDPNIEELTHGGFLHMFLPCLTEQLIQAEFHFSTGFCKAWDTEVSSSPEWYHVCFCPVSEGPFLYE